MRLRASRMIAAIGERVSSTKARIKRAMLAKGQYLLLAILKNWGYFVPAMLVFWVVGEIERAGEPGPMRTITVVLRYLIAVLLVAEGVAKALLDRLRYRREAKRNG